jgi:hypothetical protein
VREKGSDERNQVGEYEGVKTLTADELIVLLSVD